MSTGAASERLARLLDIGRALGSTLDLDQLLALLLEHGSQLLDAERCSVFIYDAERDELWSKVAQGLDQQVIRIPATRGLAGAAVSSRRPVNVIDAHEDSRFNPKIDEATGYRTGSVLAVPMVSRDDRIVGVLQALNKRGGVFDGDDEKVALALAGQAAAALENGRLYQAVLEKNLELSAAQATLRRALRELDVLYEVEQSVSTASDQETLLAVVLSKAVELLDAEAAAILLRQQRGEGLVFSHSARGEGGEDVRRLPAPMGHGMAETVALSNQPLVIDDPPTELGLEPAFAQHLGIPVRNALAVPINWEETRYGVLELFNKRGGQFGEDELRLATLVSGQIARAMHHSRSRAEEQRKGRLQLVGQMLSGLLHDLRTPMTIISGYAQLMESDPDRAERSRGREVIRKQFDAINSMIGDVLAFARGERSLLVRKVQLNFFLDDIETFVRKDLEGRPIQIEVVRGFEGSIRFDENKIRRVVFNLVRNAAQAISGPGRITLSSLLEGDHWVFRCADTGCGIPPEIAASVFEEFVTHGKAGGTGLGLALSKRIVEEHEGSICFSTEPGRGTTFTVRLPLQGGRKELSASALPGATS